MTSAPDPAPTDADLTELSSTPASDAAAEELHRSPDTRSCDARMRLLEDSSLVLRAFRSLPEHWQTVLWHTEAEGDEARPVARLLGLNDGGCLQCRDSSSGSPRTRTPTQARRTAATPCAPHSATATRPKDCN